MYYIYIYIHLYAYTRNIYMLVPEFQNIYGRIYIHASGTGSAAKSIRTRRAAVSDKSQARTPQFVSSSGGNPIINRAVPYSDMPVHTH